MADDEVRIDKQVFQDRLSQFVSAWKADKRAGDVLFGGVSSILVLMGRNEASSPVSKNNAMHFWLLGYEFPATLFLFTADKFYILTTAKKAKHLEPLQGGKIALEVLIRGKKAAENVKLFDKVVTIIQNSGKKVGVIAKDTSTGPFIDEWKKAYEATSKTMEEFDIAQALSVAALAVKDENELRAMRNASKACAGIMNPYFVEEMSDILDSEKKVQHSALAAKLEAKLDDAGFFKKIKIGLPNDFDPSQLDWAIDPVVQSGGKYDLKLTAKPDDRLLHAGIIIAGFALRYKTYCSIIARSYLVDPSKAQERNYKLLLQVHEAAIKEMRDGVVVKDVYNKAVGILKSIKPELEKNFIRNIGAGVGIETRDNTLIVNGKNTRTLKDGMTFCITTGFSDIENPDSNDAKSAVYSLVLSDTIRISRAEAVVFTADAPTDVESVSFFFKDPEEEEEAAPKPKAKEKTRKQAVAPQNAIKSKLRGERSTQVDEGAEARRRDHQKELAAKKQQEGLERYTEAGGAEGGAAKKQFKRFESYKRDGQFPPRVKDLAIVVDGRNMTVILPIMGRPVPFHINTIKNASKNDEGEFAFLRINFLSPGQGVGRKDEQPFEDASAHFVRSLTFRSKDAERMQDIATQIGEMRKNSQRKEQEKKELEDVVEQDKLVEIRNRRPQRLPNVYIRPAMDGKRVPGEVEIHQNGLRYQSPLRADHRIDILFNNVKHLFFQPCAHELIVIIHVHLKNPIVLGKKKTRDVQFYREATDIQFDETGNRKRKHRHGDEEEFEAEQEERRRRGLLDREFKSFAEKISEAGRNENVNVDIPYRELAFNGVPHRSNVLVQPSTDCVVQLTEPPFFVTTLDEIEVAHLEGVQFGLKYFDMVFVFKDFHRPVVHINTIPMESLESVKDWLDSVNIPFSEGPLNLNWATIMKTVTADPHEFFVDGGWSFLAADSEDDGSQSEEEESAFESELEDASESSEDDSDFDDDASADDDDDSPDGDSEEGEDWDELEKKAGKKDRQGALDSDDDKEKGKKSKRK